MAKKASKQSKLGPVSENGRSPYSWYDDKRLQLSAAQRELMAEISHGRGWAFKANKSTADRLVQLGLLAPANEPRHYRMTVAGFYTARALAKERRADQVIHTARLTPSDIEDLDYHLDMTEDSLRTLRKKIKDTGAASGRKRNRRRRA